jgi:hypothetical protein
MNNNATYNEQYCISLISGTVPSRGDEISSKKLCPGENFSLFLSFKNPFYKINTNKGTNTGTAIMLKLISIMA